MFGMQRTTGEEAKESPALCLGPLGSIKSPLSILGSDAASTGFFELLDDI